MLKNEISLIFSSPQNMFFVLFDENSTPIQFRIVRINFLKIKSSVEPQTSLPCSKQAPLQEPNAIGYLQHL